MSPECKVRKTRPAIGPKGCKAKPEEPFTREERVISLQKKQAKLKEDLTWTKQTQDVLRMTKEANTARKKIGERREKANATPSQAPLVHDIPSS